MNATDNAVENASSSCERWEWGCAAIVVVAVFAELVIAGLHPPYNSAWNRWGPAVADALIAFGIIGEVLFGRMDGRHQTELRGRSNEKLAAAIIGVAEANARAAEADLKRAELEAKLAPRRLSPEAMNILARELQGQIPPIYLRVLGGVEARQYARDFFHVLSSVGLLEPDDSNLRTVAAPEWSGVGVYLPLLESAAPTVGASESVPPPWETADSDPLLRALKKADISASWFAGALAPYPIAAPEWKAGRRILIIGVKPLS